MTIKFKKAVLRDETLVHLWLEKPHIYQWWDEQTEHSDGGLTRKDLFKFVRNQPSIFTHWVAYYNNTSFAYLMTSNAHDKECEFFHPYLEPKKKNLTLDFFIGNETFLNKGLSSLTLQAFGKSVPEDASALLVDPEADNEKAIHIYKKAGFIKVGEFMPNEGIFADKLHFIMKMKLPL